ncbi:hypothetical protein CASFOL_008483 [Castilleja foliolosa]|uniref:PTC1-like winged helix-turn-helix domain-containing protein n=1 Tax=Castilleja foliolosa TaxID=1961234 RepID=A0ABD3E342_9LAMI
MVMETYYRKRPKKTNHQPNVSCQKEAEEVSITATEPPSPVLGRLPPGPPPPRSSDHRALLFNGRDDDGDKQNNFKAGFLYEIDPKHLPPRTPVQLRSIRVAMVCEKTEINVAVRFPSKESLKAFFIYSKKETHPTLDEKFVMGIALANKVLVNLVTAQTFSEQKNLESFWLIDSSAAEYLYKDNNNNRVTHMKGADSGLSDSLKLNGVVRWGVRRQVKYLGRHMEIDNHGGSGQTTLPSFIDEMDGSNLELEAVCDDEKKNRDDEIGEEEEKDDGDDDEEEEDEDEDEEIIGDDQENEEEEKDKIIKRGSNMDLKRKRYHFRNICVKKPKRENVDQIKKQKNNKKPGIKKNKCRARFNKQEIILRNPKDRWSAERYKMAEENLFNVMKSKEATAEKPILRPQLRVEARKMIGDTGLLDHLLKHMAGKIAPGSDKRFRRRHNPDGAMEYWLENADLVSIRKSAGVTDPYWVPPPGWRPGDSPTQDPICARELKILKDSFNKMESDFMAIKVQLEDEVGKLRREVNELAASERKQEKENNQAITVVGSKTTRSDINQSLDQLAILLGSSNIDTDSAYVPVERYKKQLMAISDFVKEIEEKLEQSTARKEEPSLMVQKDTLSTKEKNSKQQQVHKVFMGPTTGKTTSETGKSIQNSEQLNVAAEKAAKIERMKSGFRICKPHGTFLWPNMVKDNNYINITNNSSSSGSNQVMVQVEVPTPPSVNSSTAALAQPPHHLLVKPLAEKRAVKVTVSTNYNHEDDAQNYSSNYATALVNLKNAPPKLNAMPVSQASPNTSTSPWEINPYYEARKVIMGLGGAYVDTKENNTSSLTCEVVDNKWLALSTLYDASDDFATTHG